MHHTTFGRFVGKIALAIERDRGSNHKYYTLKPQLLRQFLNKANSYDPEAMLPTKPACLASS
jgi:hypothetical protein